MELSRIVAGEMGGGGPTTSSTTQPHHHDQQQPGLPRHYNRRRIFWVRNGDPALVLTGLLRLRNLRQGRFHRGNLVGRLLNRFERANEGQVA